MIRSTARALHMFNIDHKYDKGYLTRIPRPSCENKQYALLYRNKETNKVHMDPRPLLQRSNWQVLHEIEDFHKILARLRYKLQMRKIRQKTLEQLFRNDEWVPKLVYDFLRDSPTNLALKSVSRTSAPAILPRKQQFKPVQVLFGTLIARGVIAPDAWPVFNQTIKRAVLSPPMAVTSTSSNNTRLAESRRHYVLDPAEWYAHWAHTRHTPESQRHAVLRLMLGIIEFRQWITKDHITYHKQNVAGKILWIPEPSTHNEIIREVNKLAPAVYKTLFAT